MDLNSVAIKAEDRPKRPTDEMKDRAAVKVVDALIKSGYLNAEDRDGAVRELMNVGGLWRDGYEIAKELDDRYSWDCSMDMLEYLDRYHYDLHLLVEHAQKEWAAENNIQPPMEVGTRVNVKGDTGVITGINEYGAAQFLVAIDGEKDMAGGTRRRIVNFEDAKAID